jgi:putative transposase
VADITYLPKVEGGLVTDAYSRKIVGYHVHAGLKTGSVEQAMRMAIKQRQTKTALTDHSDRSSQNCSHAYLRLHTHNWIRCSMTDGYDCYQNAHAERVNGILKCELLLRQPHDLTQARQMVRESVSIYNT